MVSKKSVLANCNFSDGDKAVDHIEAEEGSQTSTAVRRKLYWKVSILPVDIGSLKKLYLPLACKQFSRSVPIIIKYSLICKRKHNIVIKLVCTRIGMRPTA